MPLTPQRRPSLSRQVPEGHPHLGLPATPATRLACPHIDHTTQSSCSGPQGEVQAIDHAGGPSSLLLPAGMCALPKSIPDLGQERTGPMVPSASLLLLDASSFWVEEGTSYTEVSPMLCSAKVTHLLNLAGLGKGTHLFTESPVWPAAERICSSSPASRCLLWLLEHSPLCKCWWLPNCPLLPDHPWETECPASQCGPPTGWLLPAPGNGQPKLPSRPPHGTPAVYPWHV